MNTEQRPAVTLLSALWFLGCAVMVIVSLHSHESRAAIAWAVGALAGGVPILLEALYGFDAK